MEGIKEGALDDGCGCLANGAPDLKISAPDEGVLCAIKDVKVNGPGLS